MFDNSSGSAVSGPFVVVLVVVFAVSLAISIGLGFATRAIMRSKGRSGAAGFWLGFLLGLIGLVIALCLQDRSARTYFVAHPPPPGHPSWPAGQPGQHVPAGQQYVLVPVQEYAAPQRSADAQPARWAQRRLELPATIIGLCAAAGAGLPWAINPWAGRYSDMWWWLVPPLVIAVAAAFVALTRPGHPLALGVLAGSLGGYASMTTRFLPDRPGNVTSLLHLVVWLMVAVVVVLVLVARRRESVPVEYPIVPVFAVAAFAALRAPNAFDQDMQLGWVVAAVFVLAVFLVRGKAGVAAAGAAAAGVALQPIVWLLRGNSYYERYGLSLWLELAAAAVLGAAAVWQALRMPRDAGSPTPVSPLPPPPAHPMPAPDRTSSQWAPGSWGPPTGSS